MKAGVVDKAKEGKTRPRGGPAEEGGRDLRLRESALAGAWEDGCEGRRLEVGAIQECWDEEGMDVNDGRGVSWDLVSCLVLSIHLVPGAIPWWPPPSQQLLPSLAPHGAFPSRTHHTLALNSLHSHAASSTSQHHIYLQLKHHHSPTPSEPCSSPHPAHSPQRPPSCTQEPGNPHPQH